MGVKGIPEERAKPLRIRLAFAISSKAVKARDMQAAGVMASGRVYAFLPGRNSVSEATAAKLTKFLDEHGIPPEPENAPDPAAGKRPALGRRYDHASAADRLRILKALDKLVAEEGGIYQAARALDFPAATLSVACRKNRESMTADLAARFDAALARLSKPKPAALTVAKSTAAPPDLRQLRVGALRLVRDQYDGSRPELAKALHMTTRTLAQFLDGGPFPVEEADTLRAMLREQPQPNGKPTESAPATLAELVARWKEEAFRFVLQTALKGD